MGLAILLVVVQFRHELFRFGWLKHVKNKVRDTRAMARLSTETRDKIEQQAQVEAEETFFYSFTGAIVYGHGQVRRVTVLVKFVIATICDALFFVVALKLLAVLSCSYSYADADVDFSALESGVGDSALALDESSTSTVVAELLSYDTAVLLAEPTLQCWVPGGEHQFMACICMIAFGYFVPVSK